MEINKFIVQENTSVFEAASLMTENGRQIVFLCRDGKLVAAVTDGDIRRFILKRGDFSSPVSEMANYLVKRLDVSEQARAQETMKSLDVEAIPIIDSNGEIVSIKFADATQVQRIKNIDVPLVIMAGGKGTRLAPYTNVLPKPLMPIGEKTISEVIIDRFAAYGCGPAYMVINHKKELIKAYFSETAHSVPLHFVEEKQYQGTGGGLKLLEGLIDGTFFMSNCDILIDADYEGMLRQHKGNKNVVTMVCAMQKTTVPYGVVELGADGRALRLVEKPEYPQLTNTGLYLLEPEFLQAIPCNTTIHITEIIQALIDEGGRVGVYPISDAGWTDIGQLDDLHRVVDFLPGKI